MTETERERESTVVRMGGGCGTMRRFSFLFVHFVVYGCREVSYSVGYVYLCSCIYIYIYKISMYVCIYISKYIYTFTHSTLSHTHTCTYTYTSHLSIILLAQRIHTTELVAPGQPRHRLGAVKRRSTLPVRSGWLHDSRSSIPTPVTHQLSY